MEWTSKNPRNDSEVGSVPFKSKTPCASWCAGFFLFWPGSDESDHDALHCRAGRRVGGRLRQADDGPAATAANVQLRGAAGCLFAAAGTYQYVGRRDFIGLEGSLGVFDKVVASLSFPR
jgi:hypothetical protein